MVTTRTRHPLRLDGIGRQSTQDRAGRKSAASLQERARRRRDVLLSSRLLSISSLSRFVPVFLSLAFPLPLTLSSPLSSSHSDDTTRQGAFLDRYLALFILALPSTRGEKATG